MIGTITHTRRPLWLRLAQPVAVWFLSDWVRSEERYSDALRRGGVYTAEQLATRERNFAPVRALLVWWTNA